MQIRSLFELEGLPIAEGATSPAPSWGFPMAYSTVLNTYVFWKGGVWTASLQSLPPGGTQEVYMQPTQPATTGSPYLWVQTGLPNGGFTLWAHDGVP